MADEVELRESMRGFFRGEKPGFFQQNQHLKYIAPAMAVMVLLSVVPTLFTIIIAFTNYRLGWEFDRARIVWFGNFHRLFSGGDPDFWHSVWISVLFMVLATAIELALGFFIASLLNSTEFPLKPVVIGILIIPLAMTPSIAAQMWKLMLNAEYGIVNYLLQSLFDLKIIWLSKDLAFWSVLLVDVWQFTPFVALIIYAGLRSLPSEPYESAAIDGASRLQLLRYVTLPMLRKLVYLCLLMRAIDSLKLFDTAFVLTQGGPGNATEFLSLHVFRLANAQNGLIGRAAAVALVLLVIVGVISQILIKQQRKGEC
ncbi:MAG: sugar ABC transporter permease [Planctomycetota bacterium]|jgi:multiple sugar transport system permease protein|nr:sugar ABC transporter permease [Planctomycetota bacterium]